MNALSLWRASAACVALVAALHAPVAMAQSNEPPASQDSLVSAMDAARQALVDATPRGGTSPPELLSAYADACARYGDAFPRGDKAVMARSTLLSCLARMDAPQRVIDTVDRWLDADVLTPAEFDRALNMRTLAAVKVHGAEGALKEIDRAIASAQTRQVRLLLVRTGIEGQSMEQRLATIEQALMLAGDAADLRADALGAKAMLLIEQGGDANLKEAGTLVEQAQALGVQSANVLRAQMQLRSRAEALAGAGEIAPGKIAPVFGLNDIHTGKEVKLEDLRGKIVLLDFWATWCGPCVSLMDSFLVDLHRDFKDKDLVILGVGTNWRGETAQMQLAWAEAKDEPVIRGGNHTRGECSWIKVHDAAGAVTQTYGVQGIPFCVLIDREGRIVYAGNGHALKGDILKYVQEHAGIARN